MTDLEQHCIAGRLQLQITSWLDGAASTPNKEARDVDPGPFL